MSRQQSGSTTTVVVIAALVLAGLGFYLNLSKGSDEPAKRGGAAERGEEGTPAARAIRRASARSAL